VRPIGPSLELACLFVGTPSERRSHLRKNGTSPAIRDIFLLQVATSMRQDMAGMKVLVTGIDGYIGSVLGPRLLEQGLDVVGIGSRIVGTSYLGGSQCRLR